MRKPKSMEPESMCPASRRWKWPLLLACVAVYAALSWVGGCVPERKEPPPPPAEAVSSEAWATDMADAGVPLIAVPLPAEPLKGQKRSPCDKRREREINGGCWVEIAGEVGDDACGDYYAHLGRCFIPVRQAKRPPTSIEP